MVLGSCSQSQERLEHQPRYHVQKNLEQAGSNPKSFPADFPRKGPRNPHLNVRKLSDVPLGSDLRALERVPRTVFVQVRQLQLRQPLTSLRGPGIPACQWAQQRTGP